MPATSLSTAPASASFRGRIGVARSLFIGVGARGTAIASALRRDLSAAHGSLELLPTLAWMSLDWPAPPPADWKEDGRFAFDLENLNGPENDWWRESGRGEGGGREGGGREGGGREVVDFAALRGAEAALSRGAARLGFWNLWPRLEAALRLQVNRVLLAESGQQSARALGATDDSLLNIYLLADMGEGAGGALLDLAFALRFLLRSGLTGSGQTARLIGALALPDAAAAPRRAANACAALRELNHWNDAGTTWSARGPKGARFEAPPGEVPFDFATLWTPRNASGHALGEADLVRAITQWLSLDLHPDLAPARNDDRSRLASLSRATDEWNQPANYFAAGVAALEFPREALCQAVALRLAQSAWEGALLPAKLAATLVAEGDREVEKFALDFDYDAAALLDGLEQAPEAPRTLRIGDLVGQHERQWAGNISSLADAAPATAQALADEIYCGLSRELAPRGAGAQRALQMPLRLETEGAMAAQVRERFAGLEAKWQGAARAFIPARANDPQWRGEGAAALAKRLAERAAGAGAILGAEREVIATETEATWTLFEALWREFDAAELAKHAGFLGRGARKHQTALAQRFAEAGARLGALNLKTQALEALRAAFDAAPDVWTRPRADLKHFVDAVHEQSRSLRKRRESWENTPFPGGQLVLHPSNPDSVEAAVELYAQQLGSHEAGGSAPAPSEDKVAALWRGLEGQASGPIFEALMRGKGSEWADSLVGAALNLCRPFFEKTAALDLFAALYPDENRGGERVEQLFRAADAYFPLARGTVVPGWNESQLQGLRRAGFHNAGIPLRRSDAENHFYAVTKSLGFSGEPGVISQNLDLAETSRALFWSEIGGFPLRCARGLLRDLENAFHSHEAESGGDLAGNSLWSRLDIAFWLPLEAPAPASQEQWWRDFLVALATGAAVFAPLGDGISGEFSLRAAPGSAGENLVLGHGPNLARADSTSLLPWREVVFRCAEKDAVGDEARQRLVEAGRSARLLPAPALQANLSAFLATLEFPAFRRHVSDVLGTWKEQTLNDQEQHLREQLSRLQAVLQNPGLEHLHATARQKQSELQRELALFGETGAPTLSAEQELERLLSA